MLMKEGYECILYLYHGGGFVTGQRHHRRATLAAAGTRGPSEKRPGGVVVELALPVAVRRGRVTYSSSTRVSTS